MKKTIPIFLLLSFGHLLAQSNLSVNTYKLKTIQSIYKKKMRKKCKFSLTYFSKKHTRKEWKKIYEKDNFITEFSNICPAGTSMLKKSYIEPLYNFSYKYAKDSGEFPPC